MPFNKWFLYFGAYALGQLLGWVGEGVSTFIQADDVNASVGFQVDTESSGAGFIGFLRNVISFFTDVLPKLLFFNFSFLNGQLEVVQWAIMLIFGGTLIAMLVANRAFGR
jgi:hypothetical protein